MNSRILAALRRGPDGGTAIKTAMGAAITAALLIAVAYDSSGFVTLGLAVTAGLIFSLTVPLSVLVTVMIIASAFSAPAFIIPVAGVNLRPETVLIPITFLAAVVQGYGPQLWRQFTSPFSIVMLVFIFVNALTSVVNSPNLSQSLNITLWYLLDLSCLLIVLSVWGEKRPLLYRRMKFVAWLTIISGLLGWVSFQAFGANWGAMVDTESGLRANGIAFEANILAAFAAIWIYILLTQQARVAPMDWLLIVLCAIVIPLTATRAAIVGLAAGLIIAYIGNTKLLRRLVPFAFLAVAAIGTLVATMPSLAQGTLSKFADFQFTNQTSRFRYTVWDIAISDIDGWGWVFGLGTNSYGQRHHLLTDPTKTREGYIGSLPLQTLYDTGLLGVFILLLAAVLLLYTRREANKQRRLGILVLFAIIATACNPVFLANFWLFAALAISTDTGATAIGAREPSLKTRPSSHLYHVKDN